MSHFTVLVIGTNAKKQFAPFSEHKRMKKYNAGKVSKKDIASFTRVYTSYDAKRGYGAKSQQEAKQNKKTPFDILYKKHGDDWNSKAWAKDESGTWCEYSTYNPQSKWDWYVLGGRWSGSVETKDGTKTDSAKKGDIKNLNDLIPFAILNNGKWYESGSMGWFGMSHNNKDPKKWEKEVTKLLQGLPDNTIISMYDCHI